MMYISKRAPVIFWILFTHLAFAGSLRDIGSNSGIVACTTQDCLDIQHVMDLYHEAVIVHDGARLATLFIPEGSAWLNVLSDDAYARAKTKSPNAAKIRVGNFRDFAELVSRGKANFNPTHSKVQIQSDGTIACVYFDFVFFSDGKEVNRGSETWQLVKGTDGWKIAAITYSSNPS